MTVIEQIRADQIAARKAKDVVKVTLLSTLLGEIVMVGKNNGNRETTDAEAISVIKKFKKNIQDTILCITPSNNVAAFEKITELLDEEKLYDSYLPQQLSEQELKQNIALFLLADENCTYTIKDVMFYLKENYAGLYDGKTASKLANELLKT